MWVIVCREHPHPGATPDAFEIRDGYRYQAFTTTTACGQLAFLDARHRAHTRVEDRIRTGKATGLGAAGSSVLRQRTDFLLCTPTGDASSWEVEGRQHYADDDP